MSQKVSIGEAARSSGVKVQTIRYYEQIGLFPTPPRTEGNRRTFDTANLRRLAFIRHARELGFNIDAVRALLARRGRRNCPHPAGRRGAAPRQPNDA
jgi:DNA-binding transcriptional MerR regulator